MIYHIKILNKESGIWSLLAVAHCIETAKLIKRGYHKLNRRFTIVIEQPKQKNMGVKL
jgi:hypothetical protein